MIWINHTKRRNLVFSYHSKLVQLPFRTQNDHFLPCIYDFVPYEKNICLYHTEINVSPFYIVSKMLIISFNIIKALHYIMLCEWKSFSLRYSNTFMRFASVVVTKYRKSAQATIFLWKKPRICIFAYEFANFVNNQPMGIVYFNLRVSDIL